MIDYQLELQCNQKELKRIMQEEVELKAKIKELRKELNVQWTPAKFGNNPDIEAKYPERYKELAELEEEHADLIREKREIKDEIYFLDSMVQLEEFAMNYDDDYDTDIENEDLDLYHYDEN